jgi:hypothetical protein
MSPLGFALRLLGRLLAMFAWQLWLYPLNNKAYFRGVLIINSMLATLFFLLARHAGDELWRG